jgi:hypothetical protein
MKNSPRVEHVMTVKAEMGTGKKAKIIKVLKVSQDLEEIIESEQNNQNNQSIGLNSQISRLTKARAIQLGEHVQSDLVKV